MVVLLSEEETLGDTEASGIAQQFEAAFTEWDRRYREEPERFWSEAEHLLKQTPETYGQAAAPYFIAILREIGADI